jgi:hypothetical protein
MGDDALRITRTIDAQESDSPLRDEDVQRFVDELD